MVRVGVKLNGADRPFVSISVNADADVASARQELLHKAAQKLLGGRRYDETVARIYLAFGSEADVDVLEKDEVVFIAFDGAEWRPGKAGEHAMQAATPPSALPPSAVAGVAATVTPLDIAPPAVDPSDSCSPSDQPSPLRLHAVPAASAEQMEPASLPALPPATALPNEPATGLTAPAPAPTSVPAGSTSIAQLEARAPGKKPMARRRAPPQAEKEKLRDEQQRGANHSGTMQAVLRSDDRNGSRWVPPSRRCELTVAALLLVLLLPQDGEVPRPIPGHEAPMTDDFEFLQQLRRGSGQLSHRAAPAAFPTATTHPAHPLPAPAKKRRRGQQQKVEQSGSTVKGVAGAQRGEAFRQAKVANRNLSGGLEQSPLAEATTARSRRPAGQTPQPLTSAAVKKGGAEDSESLRGQSGQTPSVPPPPVNVQDAHPSVSKRSLTSVAEATTKEMKEEQIAAAVITLRSPTLPTRGHKAGSGSSAESSDQEDHLVRAMAEQEPLISQASKPLIISLARSFAPASTSHFDQESSRSGIHTTRRLAQNRLERPPDV